MLNIARAIRFPYPRDAMLLMLLLSVSLSSGTAARGSAASPLLRPQILADTNRDGSVDVSDQDGKTNATWRHGAIILPNIGDSARRCPAASDKQFSDAQLEACNDAQDDIARAPDNFAPVRALAMEGLSSSATGSVVALGPGAGKIRVFLERRGRWSYLSPFDRISAAELGKGLRLGVDSRDVVRDAAIWDGSVTLQFTVDDRGRRGEDRVAMRVAPVVVHNHLQKSVDVFAPLSGTFAAHRAFTNDLSEGLKAAGFTRPIRRIATRDNWAQDFVEFGYVSMPAPGGRARMLRIAIRSPQPTRLAGRTLFDLRGPGMGVVQTGGEGYHQVDSFGNLETVPPYQFNGRSYPAGRVLYGDAGDGAAPHRDWVHFFAAQELQAPIMLDASWLAIGHVDEFVQFVPAANARGWTIAIKDVESALELLRQARARGHGGVRAFSRQGAPELTVNDLLSDKAWLSYNELARRKIELNLEILKAETGVADAEIVRVPGLFEKSSFHDFVKTIHGEPKVPSSPPVLPEGLEDSPEEITYGPGTLIAFYPSPVNGLLLDRDHYFAPRQWGPEIDGVDIIGAAVKAAYAKVGIETTFIDDWHSHHVIGGEVHCGTNVTREVNAVWWR